MSERDAFIRAICAEPEDDTARLVFADWLEEHGESERAEFIRVQCEIAKMHRKDKRGRWIGRRNRRYAALSKRALELLGPGPDTPGVCIYECGENARAWFGERPPWVQWWAIERGFVCAIQCTAAAWLTHADAILAAQPVRRVTVSDYLPCNVRNGANTLVYTARGMAGEFDLHELRTALGMTDAPYALTSAEITIGAFAICWQGVKFVSYFAHMGEALTVNEVRAMRGLLPS